MRVSTFGQVDSRLSFGHVADPGTYATTVTRPDLFRNYLTQQIGLLIRNHGVPVEIGLSDTPITVMLRHLDHLMSILGEDGVGLGSDYDGAVVPEALTSVGELPKLRQAMAEHGYGDTLIRKLCHENWLRALERTWGL